MIYPGRGSDWKDDEDEDSKETDQNMEFFIPACYTLQ